MTTSGVEDDSSLEDDFIMSVPLSPHAMLRVLLEKFPFLPLAHMQR